MRPLNLFIDKFVSINPTQIYTVTKRENMNKSFSNRTIWIRKTKINFFEKCIANWKHSSDDISSEISTCLANSFVYHGISLDNTLRIRGHWTLNSVVYYWFLILLEMASHNMSLSRSLSLSLCLSVSTITIKHNKQLSLSTQYRLNTT